MVTSHKTLLDRGSGSSQTAYLDGKFCVRCSKDMEESTTISGEAL